MRRRADLLAGIAGGAVGAVGGPVLPHQGHWWAVLLAVASGVPLVAARVAPWPCLVAGGALVVATALVAEASLSTFVLLAAYGFVAGRFLPLRSAVVGGALLSCTAALGAAGVGDGAVPYLLVTITGWGAGAALHQRSETAAQLALRLRELEREREAYTALSVRYERARVASELHDIVGHAISVMVVQASAGQRLAATDPGSTAESFAAISDAARQAGHEMELLVRLLADEHAVPTVQDLEPVRELVRRAAGSGLDVRLTIAGEGAPSPDAGAVVYRVVQEGLTNALRYAAGAPVEVEVHGDEGGGVRVEVRNHAPAGEQALAGVGTGNGLRGLRERVARLGGTLTAGPHGEGWRLAVHIPASPPRPAATG
ncbi:MAG: histidine kinase [Thermoleophilia bacterium]